MIKLFQFAPALGLPNASPFCLKLETYLRMAAIPYENVYIDNPGKGPKGKLPFIEHEGRRIADSGFIIEYLKSRFGDPLDQGLSREQLALGHVLRRMIEEGLYWIAVYVRWADEEGWRHTREAFFGRMPFPLAQMVPPLARRGMTRELHMQGTGRHAPKEVYALGAADLTALADLLGARPFFLGERPASVDATAFGFLANILWPPIETPLKAHARTLPALEGHCRRMAGRCFPEWNWPAA